MSEEKEIEYELISIRLPKPIIDLYRFVAHRRNTEPEILIAYDVVDNWDVQVTSGMTAEQIIELLGLEQVFKEHHTKDC